MLKPARLYSRGTTLAEIPPDFRGVSWSEWEAMVWEEARVAWLRAQQRRAAAAEQSGRSNAPVKTDQSSAQVSMRFRAGAGQ